MGKEFKGISAPQPERGQWWMRLEEKVVGKFPNVKVNYIPTPCMHCDNPPCANISDRSVIKRDDGIVLIDPAKNTGSMMDYYLCPYKVIYYNPELNITQKCTFCAELLAKGEKPACVAACPMKVFTFGLDNDPSVVSVIAQKKPVPLHPEYGTNPRVLYVLK
ncbi:MAG: 4Fe-4S dicluster domain-containing protein [Nitrososphaeria archaeon]